MGTTLYTLIYGHDVVLPMEVMVQLLWVSIHNQLGKDKYTQMMLIELEDVDEARLNALDHL